jgi:hypothetical protein
LYSIPALAYRTIFVIKFHCFKNHCDLTITKVNPTNGNLSVWVVVKATMLFIFP